MKKVLISALIILVIVVVAYLLTNKQAPVTEEQTIETTETTETVATDADSSAIEESVEEVAGEATN